MKKYSTVDKISNSNACYFAFQHYRFVEIAIKQCKNSGIDCKVWGLCISGRLRNEDERTNMAFTFLASDGEEQESGDNSVSSAMSINTRDALSNKRTTKASSNQDTQTRIYVWGLNDKDQLGGPKGSKVLNLLINIDIVRYVCLFS